MHRLMHTIRIPAPPDACRRRDACPGDPMIPGRGMGLAEYRRLSTRARGIADELEGLARVVEIDIRRLSA